MGTRSNCRNDFTERLPTLKTTIIFEFGLILLMVAGCGQARLSAPTEYSTWNAKDGTFLIEYPKDWEADGGGRHNVQWATFKKGSATIDVTVSFSESVIGDILQHRSGDGIIDSGTDATSDDATAPVAVIHEAKRKDFEEDFTEYEEKEAVAVRAPLGEGRKSEFEAAKAFGRTHGYRSTFLNNDRGVTVICQCAEADWKAMQAAFDKILSGISRGRKEQ